MNHEMNFEGVYFKGTFRDYQQRVLDNSKKYLSDNKINIVAAPGSGKTILGLELIRRLNNPCIILSPTTTIRQQWGNRFEESFVYDKSRINEYVSYDLNEVTLINSITYQALYSAVNKIPTSTDEEVVLRYKKSKSTITFHSERFDFYSERLQAIQNDLKVIQNVLYQNCIPWPY